ASGGNVAFFSGNTCWWHITFDDPTTIRRPHYWHDIGRPENSLTGVSYRNAGGDWNPAGRQDSGPSLRPYRRLDLQASPPAEHALTLGRASEIKTHADAWAYMKEVQQKIAARRGSPATTEVPNKPPRQV